MSTKKVKTVEVIKTTRTNLIFPCGTKVTVGQSLDFDEEDKVSVSIDNDESYSFFADDAELICKYILECAKGIIARKAKTTKK